MQKFSFHYLLHACKLNVLLVFPAKQGFFEKFTKVYKIIVTNIAHPLGSKNLDAHHWPDKDVFIVPDVYANYCVGTYPEPRNDYQGAKKFYLNLLNKAN